MEHRKRISITLGEHDERVLRWLAGVEGRIPAQLAAGLVSDGLERLMQAGDRWTQYAVELQGGGAEDLLAQDIVAAFLVEGVPHVLAGQMLGTTEEARRVGDWLIYISLWLGDERPPDARPPVWRLAEWRTFAGRGGAIGEALRRVGGADGAHVRRSILDGLSMMSDKRQLSDMAGRGAAQGQPKQDGAAHGA